MLELCPGSESWNKPSTVGRFTLFQAACGLFLFSRMGPPLKLKIASLWLGQPTGVIKHSLCLYTHPPPHPPPVSFSLPLSLLFLFSVSICLCLSHRNRQEQNKDGWSGLVIIQKGKLYQEVSFIFYNWLLTTHAHMHTHMHAHIHVT